MGGLGDRERDSMGPSRWNRGAQSLQAAEWCARKSNCPFTPEIARKHGLKSSHREYELFLFALPPTLHWVWLIRGVSLVVNGSGERERDAGGAPPAAQQARARFYWLLVISKPTCGRHSARGGTVGDIYTTSAAIVFNGRQGTSTEPPPMPTQPPPGPWDLVGG